MRSHCRKYWASCNGEIYNFVESKRELVQLGRTYKSQNDTEVLLEAYAQPGNSCLDKLGSCQRFPVTIGTQLYCIFLKELS